MLSFNAALSLMVGLVACAITTLAPPAIPNDYHVWTEEQKVQWRKRHSTTLRMLLYFVQLIMRYLWKSIFCIYTWQTITRTHETWVLVVAVLTMAYLVVVITAEVIILLNDTPAIQHFVDVSFGMVQRFPYVFLVLYYVISKVSPFLLPLILLVRNNY